MTSLIKRLEAATGPDRELDAEISRYLGSTPHEEDGFPHWADCVLHNEPAAPAKKCDCGGWRPTGSIDAARTLGGMLVYASDIGADGLPMVQLVTDTSTSPVIEHTGIGATLELAWTIAALKARGIE